MLPPFDPASLSLRLNALSASQRLLFAAACYHESAVHYRAFTEATGWGDAARMDAWARRLSAAAAGDAPLEAQEVRAMQAHWDALVPDLDEFASPLTSAAQDAALTLVAATDAAVSHGTEDAVTAATHAINLADLLAQEEGGLHPHDPHLEAKILAHPRMQAELHRQDALLSHLEAGLKP